MIYSMPFILILLLLFNLLLPTASYSEQLQLEQSSENYSQNGAAAFQQSDFSLAFENYQKASAADPTNPVLRYNLGLAAYKQGKMGLAVAKWRQSLDLQPGYSLPLKALNLVELEIEKNLPAHELSTISILQKNLIKYISLERTLMVTSFLLLIFGLNGIAFVKKQRNWRDGKIQNQPGIPWLTIFSAILLLFAVSTNFLIWSSTFNQRATLLSKSPVKSSPDENSTPLFELPEGSEVQVLQKNEGAAQIKFSDSIVGWVKESELE